VQHDRPLRDELGHALAFLPWRSLVHERRLTDEEAIAAVPREMVEGLFWGTPAQVVAKLRTFGEAGLRYVVPWVLSAAVSPEAASYSVRAMGEIAHALRSGESCDAFGLREAVA
jgi:alkanesulfonate monooxygenase SsuD/methylene tetrahydromethanopterin reductase-like flavin-dependent oxidoreductase (luciferase family)